MATRVSYSPAEMGPPQHQMPSLWHLPAAPTQGSGNQSRAAPWPSQPEYTCPEVLLPGKAKSATFQGELEGTNKASLGPQGTKFLNTLEIVLSLAFHMQEERLKQEVRVGEGSPCPVSFSPYLGEQIKTLILPVVPEPSAPLASC